MIQFDLKWRNKSREKDHTSRTFLRDLVCLVKWIFLQVLGPTYEMCIKDEYMVILDPLDLVPIYEFL